MEIDSEKLLQYLTEQLDQSKAEHDRLFSECLKTLGNQDREKLGLMSMAGGEMVAYNKLIALIKVGEFKP
ncbi:MAG: hypothetical protein WC138_11475 [Methanoculleus sp.]